MTTIPTRTIQGLYRHRLAIRRHAIRTASSWANAVEQGERVVHGIQGSSSLDKPVEKLQSLQSRPLIDPIALVGADLSDLMGNIKSLLGSGHGMLDQVAKYYFEAQGKHVRPLIVLLMSQATSIAPKRPRKDSSMDSHFALANLVDRALSPLSVLNDFNPDLPRKAAAPSSSDILPTQRRLAEITEMIHTASLLHDDVIDTSDARRGRPSGNAQFGNKMAILAGDFLLGRASVALARLRDAEVIELLATVIANLVEGEFMQLKNMVNSTSSGAAAFEYYSEKTYLKTASLISKSCRASALLGGATKEVADIAYTYGRNLGLAFQFVDDMLDFSQSTTALGKPSGADLSLGLATAPVLYAWEEYPELGPMIARKFSEKDDVIRARELVGLSRGLERTRNLASYHCDIAIDAIERLPESSARSALVDLTRQVLTREK